MSLPPVSRHTSRMPPVYHRFLPCSPEPSFPPRDPIIFAQRYIHGTLKAKHWYPDALTMALTSLVKLHGSGNLTVTALTAYSIKPGGCA